MKKIILAIILLFFILGLATAFSENENYGKIDKEVEKLLEQKGKASVIVVLEDDYSALDEKRKLMISNIQEKVLSELDYEKEDFELKRKFSIVNGFSGEITKLGLEKLRNNPNVKKIYPNRIVKAFLSDSKEIVNATNTWKLIYNQTNLTGKGQAVCIIDTGVDYTHPDLGECFGDGCKVIGGYDFVNNDSDPMDDYGHGTHVAGIVASTNEIYTGIAPDANIVAVKVLGQSGSGNFADLIEGISWCVDNADDFNITVISMSLGGGQEDSFCDSDYLGIADAINLAIGQNISVIVATGNTDEYFTDATAGIASPACIKNSTRVTAVDKSDSMASFAFRHSNFPDILAAPGVDIIFLKNGGGNTSMSGTSMSTPHVAAAFALINQYLKLTENKIPTPHEAETYLKDTGKQIHDPETNLNFPRINIFDAILSLDETAPLIAFSDSTPEDNTNTTSSSVFISINSNEVLETALLEWNGTNQTMLGSSLNWYINKTITSTGTYSYKVYGNDFAGNTDTTETRKLNAIIIDFDGDGFNSTVDCNDTNSSIHPGAEELCNGVDDNCDMEIDEGCPTTTTTTTSTTTTTTTTTTTVPTTTTTTTTEPTTTTTTTTTSTTSSTSTSTTTTSSTTTIPVTTTTTTSSTTSTSTNSTTTTTSTTTTSTTTTLPPICVDADNDTYYKYDEYECPQGNDCNDNNSAIHPSALEVCDGIDNNCDGNIDEGFEDTDNDGLADCIDFIIGNSSHINSSLNLTFEINNTENVNNFEGKALVVIKHNNKTLVEFYFNFTNETKLDFREISYEKNVNNNSGSVIISGIMLPEGETKTLYVDNLSNLTKLCIKDAEIVSITQISSLCNGADEYGIGCPGTANNGKYFCNFTDNTTTIFKITGLDHTGIQQQTYCGDGTCNSNEDCSSCPADCGSCPSNDGGDTGGSGGGGGGGGGGSSAAYVCNMGWECTEWSECDENNWQTRECSYVKVPQHTSTEPCPLMSNPPEMAKKCTVAESGSQVTATALEPTEETEEEVAEEAEEQKTGFAAITGAVITNIRENPGGAVVLLLLLILARLLFHYRKKPTQ